jgi:hypothetical protein
MCSSKRVGWHYRIILHNSLQELESIMHRSAEMENGDRVHIASMSSRE